MDAAAVARVLLARSAEESAPESISSESLFDATVAAGPVRDEARWFARRGEHLVACLPPAFRSLLAMPDALGGGLLLFLLASVVLGLAANYLGPARQIHAVYNPIVLLIAWNLIVYLGLFLGRLPVVRRLSRRRGRPVSPPLVPFSGAPYVVAAPPTRPGLGPLSRWMFRRALPAFWVRFHRATGDTKQEAKQLGRVAKTFWAHWTEVAAPLFGLAVRRLLSLCALGLAAGAVLGMFVRGLFFDYHVVWRSTFVTSPETVATLLARLFTLPALLTGRPIPDEAAAVSLMQPDGVPADDWIWIYAAAALLCIGVPRSAMAVAYSLRLRTRGAKLDLGLGAPYYREVIQRAREQRVGEIENAIKTDVRVESGKFAAGIATYVCEKLYDGRIVPRLQRFREQGGRIDALERGIGRECQEFRPELDAYFSRAQAEFEQSLARAVAETIETDVRFAARTGSGLRDEIGGTSQAAASGVGGSIGRGLNRAIGSAVSGAVAVLAGAVSGGFGKSLGAAVVVSLLGTTGPVGFLIGALVGLVAAGGVYFLGREKAAGAIKSVALPGWLVRTLFRPGRLERLVREGRTQCQRAVDELITQRLEPLTPEISAQIWTQVKPILAEGQRATPRQA